MEEIIDLPESKSDNRIYLKKSERLYKMYGWLVVAAIMSTFIKPMFYRNNAQYQDFLDLLVVLPILIMCVLAPLGLYYSWKSYRRDEGFSKKRFKYILGHLFICLLIVVVIGVLIADIANLLL